MDGEISEMSQALKTAEASHARSNRTGKARKNGKRRGVGPMCGLRLAKTSLAGDPEISLFVLN